MGVMLTDQASMAQDVNEKQAIFIDGSVQIQETFSFAHPIEQIVAIQKYNTAIHGSPLWSLENCDKIVSAWRTSQKLAWQVPRACRTFLVETVLAPEIPSLRVQLAMRFHGFFRAQLLASPSHEVAVLARLAARDVRSNTGSNLAELRARTGLDPWTVSRGTLRAALESTDRAEVAVMDRWRTGCLQQLLTARLQAFYRADSGEEQRLQGLINSLVIN